MADRNQSGWDVFEAFYLAPEGWVVLSPMLTLLDGSRCRLKIWSSATSVLMDPGKVARHLADQLNRHAPALPELPKSVSIDGKPMPLEGEPATDPLRLIIPMDMGELRSVGMNTPEQLVESFNPGVPVFVSWTDSPKSLNLELGTLESLSLDIAVSMNRETMYLGVQCHNERAVEIITTRKEDKFVFTNLDGAVSALTLYRGLMRTKDSK